MARTTQAPDAITRIDPASGDHVPIVWCSGTCTNLAVDGDQLVACAADGFFFGQIGSTGTNEQWSSSANANSGLALSAGDAVFVSYDADMSRNDVELLDSSGAQRAGYAGWYRMAVWAKDGDDVFITEQEYLSLTHPPFVRRVRVGVGAVGRFPLEGDRSFQADRVYDARDGVALIRRVARADWPANADLSRSDIVRVRVAEVFQ
ncbi:hypothetical protein ACFL6C_12645 [Myxococcota bacterium]